MLDGSTAAASFVLKEAGGTSPTATKLVSDDADQIGVEGTTSG